MKTAVIGFPRIGKDRELKFASEKYFRGEITEAQLQEVAKEIRKENFLETGDYIYPSKWFFILW